MGWRAFQSHLVDSDFLDKLRRHFRANPYGRHSKISARLFSIYNEDRYMGPQSVVKYRFEVHLRVSPSDHVLSRLIRMEVEFRPKIDGFVCRGLRQEAICPQRTNHALAEPNSPQDF